MSYKTHHDVSENTSQSLSEHITIFLQADQDVFCHLSAAFFELDGSQHILELPSRDKAWDQGRDLVAVHVWGVFNAFRAEAQPEMTEITQLHDVPIRQLPRDDGQQGFHSRHHVWRAECGDVAGMFG